VLVADDNKDAADTLVTLIEASGGQARACYDGPSALLAAEQFHPDVCLLDLAMPGMDGDQVAARLRDADPDHELALVAVTALGSEEARSRTARAGFDIHLVKPVDPDLVLLAVYSRGGQPAAGDRLDTPDPQG
jgi:two-component system OmpR family response regulator